MYYKPERCLNSTLAPADAPKDPRMDRIEAERELTVSRESTKDKYAIAVAADAIQVATTLQVELIPCSSAGPPAFRAFVKISS